MRWISNPPNSVKARVLAAALRDSKLKIPASALPVLADLLLTRGIDEPEAAARFLAPALADLHDPLLMTGMKSALDRLEAAVERKEKILIYGDYDVDGTTAIVILKTAIELCGGAARLPRTRIASAKATACATRSSSAPPPTVFASSSASIPASAPSPPPRPLSRTRHRPHRHRPPPPGTRRRSASA